MSGPAPEPRPTPEPEPLPEPEPTPEPDSPPHLPRSADEAIRATAVGSLLVGAVVAGTAIWIALVLLPHALGGVWLLAALAVTLGVGGGLLLVGGVGTLRAGPDAPRRVAWFAVTAVGALIAALPGLRIAIAWIGGVVAGRAAALDTLMPEAVALLAPLMLWLMQALVRLAWRTELRGLARIGACTVDSPQPPSRVLRAILCTMLVASGLVGVGFWRARSLETLPAWDASPETWASALQDVRVRQRVVGEDGAPWEHCAPAVAGLAETWRGGLGWVGVVRARDAAARYAEVDPWFESVELDDPEEVRRTLVLSLASAGRPGLEELIRLLESPSPTASADACLALRTHSAIESAIMQGPECPAASPPIPPLDPSRTLAPLTRALRDARPHVPACAVAALALVGRPALPALRDALAHAPASSTRGGALWAIHAIGIWDPGTDADARALILEGITSPDEDVRISAIRAVMRRSGPGCSDEDAARYRTALSTIDARDTVARLATYALDLLRAR